MGCALAFCGSLPETVAVPLKAGLFSLVLERLHCTPTQSDELEQTKSQLHANHLGECHSKHHSNNDPNGNLHETGHQIITALLGSLWWWPQSDYADPGGYNQFPSCNYWGWEGTVFQEVGATALVGVVLHAPAA